MKIRISYQFKIYQQFIKSRQILYNIQFNYQSENCYKCVFRTLLKIYDSLFFFEIS